MPFHCFTLQLFSLGVSGQEYVEVKKADVMWVPFFTDDYKSEFHDDGEKYGTPTVYDLRSVCKGEPAASSISREQSRALELQVPH